MISTNVWRVTEYFWYKYDPENRVHLRYDFLNQSDAERYAEKIRIEILEELGLEKHSVWVTPCVNVIFHNIDEAP